MTLPGNDLFPSDTLFPSDASSTGRVGTIWSVGGWTGYEGMTPVADDLGCRSFVTNVDGWGGTGAPRVDSADLPVDGTADGASTQPGRNVTITGTVKAPSLLALLAWRDRWSAMLTSGDRYGTLTGDEAHMARECRVRRGAETIIQPTLTTGFEATFSFLFYAPDPLLYGAELDGQARLATTTGGLIFPVKFPILFGTSSSGQCILTNPGTAVGKLAYRINGGASGIVGPQITHTVNGVATVWASSLEIPPNQFATVDMKRHELLINGDAPRDNTVYLRGWSMFEPGDNEFTLACTSGGADAYVDIAGLPAWW